MALWWECLPPTNLSRVQFPDPASYVGWICCWFSTLLREVFLRVLWFSPLFKNKHFQFRFDLGMQGHFRITSFELLGALWVNKLHLNVHFYNRSGNSLTPKRSIEVLWSKITETLFLFLTISIGFILSHCTLFHRQAGNPLPNMPKEHFISSMQTVW